MNMDDLINALASGATIINNLTINNITNNAETIVNGDGATISRVQITAPRQAMPRLSDGVGYRYSHCSPLASGVGDAYRAERVRADAEYAARKW